MASYYPHHPKNAPSRLQTAHPPASADPTTSSASHHRPSSSDSSGGSILASTHAHNEQKGHASSSSLLKSPPKAKARGRSRSPFKKQRESNRDLTTEVESHHHSTQSRTMSPRTLQHKFDEMLSSRDIPADLRATLTSLNPAVKESLIRNQASVSLSALGAFGRCPDIQKSQLTTPFSSSKPRQARERGGSDIAQPASVSRNQASETWNWRASSGRGRSTSPSKSHAASRAHNTSPDRPSSSSTGVLTSAASPSAFAHMLLRSSSRKLEVESLRRLRVLLSTESPSWLADFLFTERGYEGLLRRVGELIEMEWRDEVHDDKALHELLRGLAALGATDRGRLALTSLLFRPYAPQLASQPARSAHLPTTTLVGAPAKEVNPPELPIGWERHPPFGLLSALLLSDRKPGDLNTRKLIVELLNMIPALSLPAGLKDDIFDSLKADREISSCYVLFCSEQPVTPSHLLLLLLHNPISSRSLSLLPFISQSHHPRPFKSYLIEVSSVVRDYFWIFCHGQNRFYDWRAIGEEARRRIDGPSVPGGMTGGVEFEAIAYITSHLKLINRIGDILATSSSPSSNCPLLFHVALFDSGMERLILTLRRASQHYYGAMHLALAHYIHLASRAGFKLSAEVQSWCERRLQLRNAPEFGDGGEMGVDFMNIQVKDTPKPAAVNAGHEPLPDFPKKVRAALSDPPLSSSFPAARSTSPSKETDYDAKRVSVVVSTNRTTMTSTSPSKTSPFDLPPSNVVLSSPSRPSGQESLSGHWLRQNSTALLVVTSSISSESFFDEAWPTEEEAVACSVPLPASPVKESGSTRTGSRHAIEGDLRTLELDETPTIGAPASPPVTVAAATTTNATNNTIGSLGARSNAIPVGTGTARDRIRLWEGRTNSSAGKASEGMR